MNQQAKAIAAVIEALGGIADDGIERSRDPRTMAIRSALAALRALPVDEWMPIETAPRDGTVILLAGPNVNSIAAAWNKHNPEYPWAFLEEHGELNGYPGTTVQLNRWRPLPEAPATLTCTACDHPISAPIRRDANDLPFCEGCYEDLRRQMDNVPKEEK